MSFFAMGGYAAYVWPAFGIAAAILIVLLVMSAHTLRKREKLLRKLDAGRGGRRRAEGEQSGGGVDGAPEPATPSTSGEERA